MDAMGRMHLSSIRLDINDMNDNKQAGKVIKRALPIHICIAEECFKVFPSQR